MRTAQTRFYCISVFSTVVLPLLCCVSSLPSRLLLLLPLQTIIKMARTQAAKKSKGLEPVARICTINLHKRLHGVSFKNKAPRALREIKAFAASLLKTSDVRVDADVNKYVWSKGIRNVPFRVRVKLSRRRNEDEDNKKSEGQKFYTLVELEEVERNGYKGLTTEKAEIDE